MLEVQTLSATFFSPFNPQGNTRAQRYLQANVAPSFHHPIDQLMHEDNKTTVCFHSVTIETRGKTETLHYQQKGECESRGCGVLCLLIPRLCAMCSTSKCQQ